MGAYTCEFGVVHKVCRCPEPHTIKCDKVDEHKTATGGEWLPRPKTHTCARPWLKSEAPQAESGDRWKCNVCGKVWKVVGFDSGMQWDPYPTVIKWERVVG